MSGFFTEGFLAAVLAGLVTGVGGFLTFFKSSYSKDDINLMLNIAAGVMLAASFFSLMEPALEGLRSLLPSHTETAIWFSAALFGGMFSIAALNAFLPHEHEISGHHGTRIKLSAAWLFVIAISIHKMPEGLAIGVAYGGERLGNPESLTIGIALQNIPEGLTVAIALISAGYSRLKAAVAATLSGMMQPGGAVAGLLIADIGSLMVPLGMAFAGGAMMFVIVNEILPETYDAKQDKRSAPALFTGFILMCGLSIAMQ